jgi:AcrR family transcriptional regulator
MPQPVKSIDRFPADSRKRQIVETVLELVAAHGTEAVSAQLVADAIGVTQPAVFRHFPTKEAMWLAVMDWLEQRLVAIYAAADDGGEARLVVLSRMFLENVKLIERYPALAKLVFSDHLRLQFPSLQARFGKIHKAYTARLAAVIDRAKADGAVGEAVPAKDAATVFLSLIQGLGFQFVIARLPLKLSTQAEQVLALYLRAIISSAKAAERALGTIEMAKRRRKAGGRGMTLVSDRQNGSHDRKQKPSQSSANSTLNKHAVSRIDNERIDVPASNSAYCKASRPVDSAFGSAICRANSLRFRNLLFPIHRARTGLCAVWVKRPLHFLSLAARKTRAGLRLDWVSGVVRFYLQYSDSLRYRIRSSSPHARAINYTWPTSD